jgi:hypothetical protein
MPFPDGTRNWHFVACSKSASTRQRSIGKPCRDQHTARKARSGNGLRVKDNGVNASRRHHG